MLEKPNSLVVFTTAFKHACAMGQLPFKAGEAHILLQSIFHIITINPTYIYVVFWSSLTYVTGMPKHTCSITYPHLFHLVDWDIKMYST
jgi:hypothetical protein